MSAYPPWRPVPMSYPWATTRVPDREVGRRAGGDRACDVDAGDERIGPCHTALRRDGKGVLVVDAGILHGDLHITLGQEAFVDNLVFEGYRPFRVLMCDQSIDCDHEAHSSPDAKAPDWRVGGFRVFWSLAEVRDQIGLHLLKLRTPVGPVVGAVGREVEHGVLAARGDVVVPERLVGPDRQALEELWQECSPPPSSLGVPLPQYTHRRVLFATSAGICTIGSLRFQALFGSSVGPHMSFAL